MNIFARCFAPEDDLGSSGSADLDKDTSDAGDDAAPSMEDTIRDTYRELTGEKGGEESTEGTEPPKEAKDPKHKAQPRDKGRFTKEGAAPAAAATVEGEQPVAPVEGQQPGAQAKPHDAIPNTWRKELAAEWGKLPEAARQEIHRREQDMHNGLRQYKSAADFGSSIAREMQPYQKIMQERGVTPQVLVRDIMGTLNGLATGSDESKAGIFLKLASTYGINLDTLQTQHQRAPAAAAPDLSPVLQRVQGIETRIQQADEERQRQQQAEDDAVVNRFLNDPKNEHASTVREQMAALLTSGQAKDLADAYEQAIWLHPETRQKLLAKQDTERRQKEADAAKNARRASSTNVIRRGTPPVQTKPGTIDDTIRNKYRELTGS